MQLPPMHEPDVQSMSVEHDWQMPAEQRPVVQSWSTLQRLLGEHPLGHEPPQSASVSLPLVTPSMQVAYWQ